MSNLSKACFSLLLCFFVFQVSAQSPVVKTAEGYIRGVIENGIPVFKGIPYAQPPVGSLRYMPPMGHEHWTDTLNAAAFGSPAVQPGGTKASGTENCLYLNLYTPAVDQGRRPVVVWVHGGSMTNGSGSGMNGHAFADKDDIVTITINYRLGALGFLYLGDMDPHYAQSGNLGLLDVVAVLKWIRENITAFGGDPDKVTLMGESAGAKLISAVMVSPASKGLFQQAILESGAVQCIRDTTTARNERTRLLNQLGLGPNDARKLLDLPADTLIRAQGRICEGIGGNSQFGPVYDGITITDDAYRYTSTGVLSHINVLIGTNENEGAAFIGPNADYLHANTSIFEPLFQHGAPSAYAYYKLQLKTDSPYAAAIKTLTQYMYQMHTYRFARALAAAHSPVWMYRYEYQGHQRYGARHGNELHYIWDAEKIKISSADDAEKQLAANMHAAWVSFIKSGSPQISTLPEWPQYDSHKPQVLFFDTTETVKTLQAIYDDKSFPSAVFVIH